MSEKITRILMDATGHERGFVHFVDNAEKENFRKRCLPLGWQMVLTADYYDVTHRAQDFAPDKVEKHYIRRSA